MQGFSPWRCIFSPSSAVDGQKIDGYAKLNLHIKRAVSLLAADASGKSDPYVVVEVNNTRTGHKTSIVKKTLAPTWNEDFDIGIYYPDSVLTLLIYDSDWVSINEINQRLGDKFNKLDGRSGHLLERYCSDDFIGFVDIQLNVLPYNQEFQGWYPVRHPKKFTDSALGRIQNVKRVVYDEHGEPLSDPGQIRLKMNLQVDHHFAELFASCLGSPHLGVPAPDLDIVHWYSNIRELAEKAKVIQEKVQASAEWLQRYSAVLLILTMFLAQMPVYILPLLLTGIIIALLCSLWPGSRGTDSPGGHDGNTDENPIPPLSGFVKEVLNRLAAILPKDHERDLRLSQEQTQVILESLKTVECIFQARGKGIAVLAALGLVCAALVLMKNWQAWIIRNGITAACAVTLVGQTCPFRVALGVGRYLLRPGRHLRSLRAEEETATISRRDIAKITLQRSHTTLEEKFLGVGRRRSVGLQPHDLEDANAGWLDHCETCGAYVCGGGKRCRACGHRLCLRCADENIPHCTGKMRKQQVPGSAWGCGTVPGMNPCSMEWSRPEAQNNDPEVPEVVADL